ncbi:hypothetical protein D3C78_1392200 [compost metagenome]
MVRKHDRLLGSTLHDRDELDVLRLHLIAEKAIDLQRVIRIASVHRTQDIGVDPVPLQAIPSSQHLVERASPFAVNAVDVMHGSRPVNADPDEKVVLPEEAGPLVVHQRCVGLHGVLDLLVGSTMPLGQLHRSSVEIEAAQHGLAALPGDFNLRS